MIQREEEVTKQMNAKTRGEKSFFCSFSRVEEKIFNKFPLETNSLEQRVKNVEQKKVSHY
jgi:hypothetical protein